MTSTPPPRSPLAALQAHDRATAARVLPALDRADRADLDALQVLARAPVDMARHLDRTDDQKSEKHHNGKAP